GRLKALVGADLKSDPAVDTEVAPPSLSVAVGRWWMQALRRGLLGDSPIRAGVVQAPGDQSAEIDRGDAVVQPPVVFGGPAVAQFAVAAHDPGDAAFDHWPVLSVNRLKFRCFGLSAGSEQHRVVLVQGEFSAPLGGGAAGPQRAVATPDAK